MLHAFSRTAIAVFTLALYLCVGAAELLFHVPLRGSVIVLLVVSSLYLLVA